MSFLENGVFVQNACPKRQPVSSCGKLLGKPARPGMAGITPQKNLSSPPTLSKSRNSHNPKKKIPNFN